jgi:hypothetical protein
MRIPFVDMSLGRFGRVPSSIAIAPWAHGVWLVDSPEGGAGFSPSVGVGVIGFFDLLRLDVGRALRGSGWLVSIDVTRDLWPVL